MAEIITFIDKKGIRYSCMALGTKKIESKNARNLFIGSLIEFQIFKSRGENKLSKLKKATVVEEADWKIDSNQSFNILTNCITKVKYTSSEFFIFYKQCLELIDSKKYNEQINSLIILFKFLKINGINIELDNCVMCGKNNAKYMSIDKAGVICEQCSSSQYGIEVINNLKLLDNKKYNNISEKINSTIKYLKEVIYKVLEIRA
jgi:DNA repair protein RecO (recombination protein O)